MESLMFARAKRAGNKVTSYGGYGCGCGCGPFPIDRSDELSSLPTPTPPQSKNKPTKRKKGFQHPMFTGKVVD